MHIPDGFIDVKTAGFSFTLCFLGLGLALKRVREKVSEQAIPLMGVMAAFIFAAQMINFPIAGGTSGHFLGSTLAAVTLGPWAGAIVMSLVVIVQCLLFQDGGITALGANILNMALLGVFTSYWIFSFISRLIGTRRGLFIGSGLGAFGSVVIASVACALEVGASGIIPITLVLPVMAFVHSIIGVFEAILTVSIIAFIFQVRPDIFMEKTFET